MEIYLSQFWKLGIPRSMCSRVSFWWEVSSLLAEAKSSYILTWPFCDMCRRSPALQADSLLSELPGKPIFLFCMLWKWMGFWNNMLFQNPIHFQSWIIFHCIYTLPFVYLFIYQWKFELCLLFGCCDIGNLNI